MELFYVKSDRRIENSSEKFRPKYVIKKTVYDNILLVLKDTSIDVRFKV